MFLSCNEFSNIYIERGVKYSYRNCLLLGMGERERERNIVTETAYSLAAMDKDVFYELRWKTNNMDLMIVRSGWGAQPPRSASS